MKYQIYKLHFLSAVHFGDGGLMVSGNILHADTIFSALCIEALRQNCLDQLIEAVQGDRLRISDGLPYIGDKLYVPKPMAEIEMEQTGNSIEKKNLKKLLYISAAKLDDYLQGRMHIAEEVRYFHENFGSSELIEKVHIVEGKDNEPYSVSIYRYGENAGLYMIAAFESDEEYYLLSDLMDALGYEGLGGERSSGYGRFEAINGKMDPQLQGRLEDASSYKLFSTLSVSIPQEQEMEAVVPQSRYKLIKRSGYVYSAAYAETFRKKRESYLFDSGAVFGQKYSGCLLDVSCDGAHPVYRYAKPLFMGVR